MEKQNAQTLPSPYESSSPNSGKIVNPLHEKATTKRSGLPEHEAINLSYLPERLLISVEVLL